MGDESKPERGYLTGFRGRVFSNATPKVGLQATTYLWRQFLLQGFAAAAAAIAVLCFLASRVTHTSWLRGVAIGLAFIPLAIGGVSFWYQARYRTAATAFLGVDRKLASTIPLKSPGFERWCEWQGVQPREVGPGDRPEPSL